MRLFEVGRFEITASVIYDNLHGNFFHGVRKIDKIDGYEIDAQFSPKETSILRNALGQFYERFLQGHSIGCPELLT